MRGLRSSKIIKEEKMELIKQENDQKEMEDWTFHPQLITQQNPQRRNFDEFLESQRKHEEDKALKRNIMLEQESLVETGVIHHPEINESSRRMLANRKDADLPVYERLYGISKNSKINQIVNQVELNPVLGSEPGDNMQSPSNGAIQTDKETYMPKINQRSKEIVRDQPVQELLYNDALRRKDMSELRKTKTNIKDKNKRSREISGSNIEHLIHRFNKEFEPTFEAVASQVEEGSPEILNYRQLGELLFDMGFLSGSASSESEERILLSSMWTGLGGAQNEGLHKEVIRAFLLAVEGVKITESVVKSPSEEEFGLMKDGEFFPDWPKISKHFKLMYLNRIRYCRDGTKRKMMRIESEVNQNWTFQPVLTENTQNLAQKYRQKIADNYEGGKITVLDILTAQTNKEQWIEETKKEISNKESQEWTFHPVTNENFVLKQDETAQSTGDKWFDLYQLANIKKKNKVDKTKEEYDIEKNGNEWTFAPNIYKETKRSEDKPHYVNQRSIQENYERMKKAREEREFKKRMTERGFGEPIKGTAKQAPKKQSVKRPTNYTHHIKKEVRASTEATAGSKPAKEETKIYSGIHNAAKRRTPQERNEVARATKSSQAKNVNAPVNKPASKSAKSNRPIRAIAHKGLEEQLKENYGDPDRIYRNIEDEEREIIDDNLIGERDQQDRESENDGYNDEIANYANQESPDYGADEEVNHGQGSPNEMYEGQDDEQRQDEDGERNPLLFVDVNLGPGRSERIVVFEGDTAEQLADDFTKKHGLDDNLKEKLVKLLESQIAGLLARIDEELTSNDTENHD